MPFKRLEVLQQIHQLGMVPVFFNKDVDIAIEIAKACVDGGAKVLEFTNRGEGALEVFSKLNQFLKTYDAEAILGVGSIVDDATAALFVSVGAQFIVGPNIDEGVALFCNKRKIAYMPGCGTVSEIHKAESLGVEICKLFPGGSVGGPDFVKAVLAPRPWSSLMPTGGVKPTEDSLREWFAAGIVCAGMGSQLIRKDLIEAKKFDELQQNVRSALQTIKDLKKS